MIEKHHDRIVSLHLKDRTADDGNVPWGQGKTPIKQILQLMRKERWTFPADIELEYKIPEGSNSVAEVAKCVQYCKEGSPETRRRGLRGASVGRQGRGGQPEYDVLHRTKIAARTARDSRDGLRSGSRS